MAKLFGNNILTPSRKFVNEFMEIFGVDLMHSNAKWYEHMLSAMTQKYQFKIIKFDDYLQEKDPEYNSNDCTYQGRPGYSCSDYIQEKYGNKAVKMVEYLLARNFDQEFEYIKEAETV